MPLDLQAQKRAACIAEFAAQKRTPGKANTHRGRVPSPVGAKYEDLAEEEADIIGAYCELQLAGDLIDACADAGTDEQLPSLPAGAVALLDEEGLDPNLFDSSGRTPLMAAAGAGHATHGWS